jgi:CheY-like chemotaxis protein
MNKKFILIVDDDEDIRETLRDALTFEGYEAVTTNNGAEALKYLQQSTILPGLIILDLMMPVMDGSKFIEVINADYKDTLAKIPLILATAKGSHTNVTNSELAHERIKKPIELDDLYSIVGKYCSV